MGDGEVGVQGYKKRDKERQKICNSTSECICDGCTYVTKYNGEIDTQDRREDHVLPLPWDNIGEAGTMSAAGEYHQSECGGNAVRGGHHHEGGGRKCKEI